MVSLLSVNPVPTCPRAAGFQIAHRFCSVPYLQTLASLMRGFCPDNGASSNSPLSAHPPRWWLAWGAVAYWPTASLLAYWPSLLLPLLTASTAWAREKK
ncbi:uncharacterized protein BO95DRAFT_184775 [Aspergillus brunneoviolaceus CBS 621.78]|uniref:Uncharacterized protein n=2 Tax=Aspergillus TaxID=5052 RepID=A0A8G1RVL3_9EURO|nr:hypothetical protein BO95DRAFT_184775 [Aspergillus brunneoviolaceus CBS 621.78]XP_040802650.1 uncharacterized protein BO72DRAFT_67021 [Aspergillus fijiensis CBS 313.89]RAH44101.1 hypothetical protein BO95DRAFT_184775 [Aspergillus brunneoviolaceus CBS 621.78]RAK78640.1 hypothetical protein BO72DRAFT_67021 [Aspergillus fijiensis CBS 313.89]